MPIRPSLTLLIALLSASPLACSGTTTDADASGGADPGTGGAASGGAASGGAASGGTASGGTASGGTASGGTASGGTASGGAASGGAASGGTGAGGDGGSGGSTFTCFDPYAEEGMEPTFTNVKWMMENSPNGPCSASDCHGQTDLHPEKLILAIDDGLLERMKTHVTHRCNDLTVVVPGDPENSAMVRALRGECTDSEGEPLFRMPGNCNTDPDCNCFYPSWMEAVEAWILAGAPDN